MRFRIALLAALATLLGTTNAVAEETVVLKFSHVVAENTPKGKMALHFKELVESRLPGKVEVQVFPNSQLFGDNKVLEAMLLGDVQIAAPSLSKFGKFTKKLGVFDLPFLFDDINAVTRFQQSDAGQKLLDSTRRRGLVGLGFLHNGMKQLSANVPLRTPQDADGMKFRIMSSDVLAAQFEAVGATPLKKPFSEVFTLLQTRAIDGAENPWSNIYSKKFFEVQDYITESDHGYLGYMVVTSRDWLDNIKPELRKVVLDSMKEAIAYGNKIADDLAMEQRQLIIDSGRSKVIKLTKDERKKWVTAMTPVWKQFEKEIGKDLIDAALASNK